MSAQAEEIKVLLSQYAEFQQALDVNQVVYQNARSMAIPTDVQTKLAEIEVEFSGRDAQAHEHLERIKKVISEKMVMLPEVEFKTIKAFGFMIVAKGGKKVSSTDADTLVKGFRMLAVKYPAIAAEISDILAMAEVEKVTNRSTALQAER